MELTNFNLLDLEEKKEGLRDVAWPACTRRELEPDPSMTHGVPAQHRGSHSSQVGSLIPQAMVWGGAQPRDQEKSVGPGPEPAWACLALAATRELLRDLQLSPGSPAAKSLHLVPSL